MRNKSRAGKCQISAVLRSSCARRAQPRPERFSTNVHTAAARSPGVLCDASLLSSPARLRQPGLRADLSGPAPDDVLHEHGQPVADRAAAPQPAALPQEAAAPHHLHRRAAGGPGRPLPGDKVPGRRHSGAAGPQGPPPGGEGRGQGRFGFTHSFMYGFLSHNIILSQ